MSKQVVWTKLIIETFIEEGCLSKEETEILRTRAAGWPISKQAEYFGISVSTVNRIVARLKVKYDKVQKYSLILPPRKGSVEETFMDSN